MYVALHLCPLQAEYLVTIRIQLNARVVWIWEFWFGDMFFVWIWLDFVLKRARQYLPLVALLGGCTGWELAMVMWEKRQVLLQKHNGTAQCTLAQNCTKNHLQTFAHKKRRTQKCEKICCKYFHIKGKHRNVREKIRFKHLHTKKASYARLVCTNPAKAAAAAAHISLPRLKWALTMQCATCLHKSCQNSCCSCCSCTYFTVPA